MKQDPAVAATLGRRARIFEIVDALKKEGSKVSVAAIEARMQSAAQPFASEDFTWVRTMLGRRIG